MLLKAVLLCLLLAAAVAVAEDQEPRQVEDRALPSLSWPSLIRSSVDLVQGRGKKDQGQGAMMVGAMMIAMGLTALAALSGKAMAASLAALMLAAASLLRKGSEGGAHAYELVAHHRSLHDAQPQRHHHDHHDHQDR